jgi:hypothetical protein
VDEAVARAEALENDGSACLTDVSDIDALYLAKGKGPHLLEIDWIPVSPGPESYKTPDGVIREKWWWQHVITKHKILRHLRRDKTSWDTGKMYDYCKKKLQRHNFPKAYDRFWHIAQINGIKDVKIMSPGGDEVCQSHERGVLLLQQVRAVMFAIESNAAVSSLQGPLAKRYFKLLDPLHKPPHRESFMRICRLLHQSIKNEYHRIVRENVVEFGRNFASSYSDFYTNPERRDVFGCVVTNMQAKKYTLKILVLFS